MSPYRATSATPPVVQHALDLAAARGFTHSCEPAVGHLLQTLAAGIRYGRVGEIGTGCGVGAAWLLSGLVSYVPFVSVDQDEERSAAAREVLAPYPQARLIAGDWHAILAHAPFTLLFDDVTQSKQDEPELVLEALAPGGIVVLDDLTPEDRADLGGATDPVRAFWLNDPRLAAAEILLTRDMAAIIATRLDEPAGW